MRDDDFLKQRLDSIWELLFTDVEKKNKVVARFKGKWRNKFGHIKRLRDGSSEIVVNGYFKDEVIPEYIIDVTIAHELVHYMHGFNSPHERKYKHPHAGGIVDKELVRRGFGHVIRLEKKWTRNEWKRIIKEEFYKPKRKIFRWF